MGALDPAVPEGGRSWPLSGAVVLVDCGAALAGLCRLDGYTAPSRSPAGESQADLSHLPWELLWARTHRAPGAQLSPVRQTSRCRCSVPLRESSRTLDPWPPSAFWTQPYGSGLSCAPECWSLSPRQRTALTGPISSTEDPELSILLKGILVCPPRRALLLAAVPAPARRPGCSSVRGHGGAGAPRGHLGLTAVHTVQMCAGFPQQLRVGTRHPDAGPAHRSCEDWNAPSVRLVK